MGEGADTRDPQGSIHGAGRWERTQPPAERGAQGGRGHVGGRSRAGAAPGEGGGRRRSPPRAAAAGVGPRTVLGWAGLAGAGSTGLGLASG